MNLSMSYGCEQYPPVAAPIGAVETGARCGDEHEPRSRAPASRDAIFTKKFDKIRPSFIHSSSEVRRRAAVYLNKNNRPPGGSPVRRCTYASRRQGHAFFLRKFDSN